MNENSKKRSRKSKLEPRMYMDLDTLDKSDKVKKNESKTEINNEASEAPSTSTGDPSSSKFHLEVKLDSGDEDDWWKDLEREASQSKKTRPDPNQQIKVTVAPNTIKQEFKPTTKKSKKGKAKTRKTNTSDVSAIAALDTTTQIKNLNDLCVPYKLAIYAEQTVTAMKACLKALKEQKSTTTLTFDCQPCNLTSTKLVEFKTHINCKHSKINSHVTITPNSNPIGLLAIQTYKDKGPPLMQAKINEELAKFELHTTKESIVLCYKCYECDKSWEHYGPFEQHVMEDEERHHQLIYAVEHLYTLQTYVHVNIAAKQTTVTKVRQIPLYCNIYRDQEIFKCCKCQTGFPNSLQLDVHRTEMAVCTGCSMRAACYVIKLHQRSCAKYFTNFYPKFCKCGLRIPDVLAMTRHQLICKSLALLAFSCSACIYTSPCVGALVDHQISTHKVRTDHFMVQSLSMCGCGKQHVPGSKESHFCPETKRELCLTCGNTYPQKLSLDLHQIGYMNKSGCLPDEELAQDSERLQTFACKMCWLMLVDEDMMIKHVKEKHRTRDYKKIYPLMEFIYIENGVCHFPESFEHSKKSNKLREKNDTELSKNSHIEISIKETEILPIDTVKIKLEKIDPEIDIKENILIKNTEKEKNTNLKENLATEPSILVKQIKQEKLDDNIDIIENAPGVLCPTEPDAAIKEEVSNVFAPSKNLSMSQIVEYKPVFIKSEPIDDDDDEEDIIILHEVEEYHQIAVKNETIDEGSIDNEDGIQTIDQFIQNNKEITMIESETLLDEERREKKQKFYYCSKCEFTGIHKDYSAHLDECLKKHPRKKKIPSEMPSQDELSASGFLCSRCNITFADVKYYLDHLPNHGIRKNTCPECKFMETTPSKLRLHVLRHLNSDFVRVYIIHRNTDPSSKTQKVKHCKKCRQMVEPQDFWAHWESHLKAGNEVTIKTEKESVDVSLTDPNYTLSPDLCKELTEILVQESPKKVFDYRECPVCENRRFNRINDYKRHLIEHLKMDALGKKIIYGHLRCQICAKNYHNSDAFKKHMREHALLPLYQCHICNKSFSDSSNFAKHKKVHNLRVLICDLCKKKFQCKSMLAKHMMLHETMTPHKCEICSKEFLYTSEYNRHKKVRHGQVNNTYRCKICYMKFDSVRKKWEHEWEVHKERKTEADCPVCHKQFRKNTDVRHHLKVAHNGMSPAPEKYVYIKGPAGAPPVRMTPL